jgi:hypothetical protein
MPTKHTKKYYTNRSKDVSKHGDTGSSEHEAWKSMRKRCLNPNHKAYYNYGGRGITICDEWKNYPQFLVDMGRKPSSHHSLDRINNNGNYEPNNCRWATRITQRNNQRKRGKNQKHLLQPGSLSLVFC